MDLTPQQEAFLAYYTDPKSVTWSNGYQSAIKAGYKEEYAKTITAQMPAWLSENINKSNLIRKAERNLDKALEGLLDDPNSGKKDIQWKATDMTLRTLRKEDFTERQEHTGANGEKLFETKEAERAVVDGALDNI